VANHGSREVFLLDRTGGLVRTIGGEGEGPGEFEMVRFARSFRGDSILAWDSLIRRGSVFGPGGEHVRTIRAPEEAFGHRPVDVTAVFPDGTLLAYSPSRADRLARGFYANHLLTLSPDGEPLSEIAELPAGACASAESCHIGWFGAFAAQAPGVSDVYHGYPAERYEIARYGRDGRLKALIRREWTPIPITDATIQSYERYVLDNDPDASEEAIRRAVERQDVPPHMPAFAMEMAVDAARNLWVREYETAAPVFHSYRNIPEMRSGDTSPWSVFDDGGGWLGVVRLPSRLRVTQIGEDFVLGVHTDDLGIETVRTYALDRG